MCVCVQAAAVRITPFLFGCKASAGIAKVLSHTHAHAHTRARARARVRRKSAKRTGEAGNASFSQHTTKVVCALVKLHTHIERRTKQTKGEKVRSQ